MRIHPWDHPCLVILKIHKVVFPLDPRPLIFARKYSSHRDIWIRITFWGKVWVWIRIGLGVGLGLVSP